MLLHVHHVQNPEVLDNLLANLNTMKPLVDFFGDNAWLDFFQHSFGIHVANPSPRTTFLRFVRIMRAAYRIMNAAEVVTERDVRRIRRIYV